MLLKPFEDEPENNVEVLPPEPRGILSILGEAGIDTAGVEEESDPEKHIQHILKEHGASLESAAKNLANLMASADSDSARLGAIRTAFEMHGVLKKTEDQSVKAPTFNITIVGTGNKALINLLTPTT